MYVAGTKFDAVVDERAADGVRFFFLGFGGSDRICRNSTGSALIDILSLVVVFSIIFAEDCWKEDEDLGRKDRDILRLLGASEVSMIPFGRAKVTVAAEGGSNST